MPEAELHPLSGRDACLGRQQIRVSVGVWLLFCGEGVDVFL